MSKEIMTPEAESREKEASYEDSILSHKKRTLAKVSGLLAGTALVVGFHALQGFADYMDNRERSEESRDNMALRQAEEAEVRTMRSKIAWAGGPAVVVDRDYNDKYEKD